MKIPCIVKTISKRYSKQHHLGILMHGFDSPMVLYFAYISPNTHKFEPTGGWDKAENVIILEDYPMWAGTLMNHIKHQEFEEICTH